MAQHKPRPSVRPSIYSPAIFILVEAAEHMNPPRSIFTVMRRILVLSLEKAAHQNPINPVKAIEATIALNDPERAFWRTERTVNFYQERPIRCTFDLPPKIYRKLDSIGASLGFKGPRYVTTRLIERFVYDRSLVAHRNHWDRTKAILLYLTEK